MKFATYAYTVVKVNVFYSCVFFLGLQKAFRAMILICAMNWSFNDMVFILNSATENFMVWENNSLEDILWM